MNAICPNHNCKVYSQSLFQVKDGFYYRRDDSRYIQRFKCKICYRKYSNATLTLEKYQKKRRINYILRANLSSGMSMRASAYNLKVSQKTIERKLIYLSKKAKIRQLEFLNIIKQNPVHDVQLDDLISSVHTKLKPVSVSVVIDAKNYIVLGAKVAEIPAFGKLAKLSRKKYGRRVNQHPLVLQNLLNDLTEVVHRSALIKTDEHKMYPLIIKNTFPCSRHKVFKSLPASIAGMGELKTKKYDPLFAINHTLASFRYGIDRLIRRTWCTSKSPEHLQMHIDIFLDYYNEKKLWKRFKSKKIKKIPMAM